jgi:hypothetical protein
MSGRDTTLAFDVFLAPHVLSGLICVVTGAITIVSQKRGARHTRLGLVYYWAFCVVFVSATGLAALRWSVDWYLFVVGAVAWAAATLAYAAHRVRWRGWLGAHIAGMGVSYIGLLTAFYVDNGPHLPIWQLLPPLAFWLLPSLIGLPLILRALVTHSVALRAH